MSETNQANTPAQSTTRGKGDASRSQFSLLTILLLSAADSYIIFSLAVSKHIIADRSTIGITTLGRLRTKDRRSIEICCSAKTKRALSSTFLGCVSAAPR